MLIKIHVLPAEHTQRCTSGLAGDECREEGECSYRHSLRPSKHRRHMRMGNVYALACMCTNMCRDMCIDMWPQHLVGRGHQLDDCHVAAERNELCSDGSIGLELEVELE